MNTHMDNEHAPQRWLDSLKQKAEATRAEGRARITGGEDGEPILNEWKSKGVSVRQLPSDEHGILRISIGGGDTPIPLDYLVFRGDYGACVDLLRKALKAMESGGS